MATVQSPPATLDDLALVSEKAELIGGRIVYYMATGWKPGKVGGRIFRNLADYADATGRGEALPDNVGFAVPVLASGRQSFSPDVAFLFGPFPANPMRFIEAPPMLAVEVRSEGDYGPAAGAEMAAKRADYFEAGTLVVWDVDPVTECIQAYRPDSPDRPVTYRRGQVAAAEPVLPGWTIAVDWIFG